MEFVLTPEQMQQADKTAIEIFGIPSFILMENAARSAFEIIYDLFKGSDDEVEIFIFCGSGNNGGDGFALARHLNDFFKITLFWIGKVSKMSAETKTNFEICNKLDLEVIHLESKNDINNIQWTSDCIIDAMIGVGGSENIRGIATDILNKIADIDVLKIAIDAPTGLNTLTGQASNNCFKADITVTMYAKKLGQLINTGPKVCGEIITANLGSPIQAAVESSDTVIFENEDVGVFFSNREKNTSKFDYGRLVIIAGCKKYPGAAALAANAAMKSGSGLVELFSEVLHPQLLPEVICYTENQDNNYWQSNYQVIKERIEKADTVLIGPGLGASNVELFRPLFEEFKHEKNIILDADAIGLIELNRTYNKNIIITPHSGEFSKLTGIERSEVETNFYFLCKEWAKKFNCILHLKGPVSVTSDGEETFLTKNGNPGMATAGSGDVLAGIISSLVSQGTASLIAASFGSYIHAEAGNIYSTIYNEQSLTASELINYLPFSSEDFDAE